MNDEGVSREHRFSLLTALLVMMVMLVTGCGSKANVPDRYDYDDFSEYITLAEYTGIEYEAYNAEVSDQEIRDYVDIAVADSGSTIQNTTGTVGADSVVNINYLGKLNGVEFDGGAADDVELDIADNNYIDGFAEGIIGHKAGETFDINVTFPENYGNEELAGQDAVFTITVNYIVEEELPEYNDEWVKNNTEYSSVKEYEKSVREELLASRQQDAEANARQSVFSEIVNNTEVVKYPEDNLQARIDKITNSYQEYAKAGGYEFEEYLNDQMGISLEQFNQLAKQASEETVKQELILHAIARSEGIEMKADDYNKYLIKLLEDAGYTEETYKEEKGYTIQEYAEDNDLFNAYLYQTVMNKVMEYSIAK